MPSEGKRAFGDHPNTIAHPKVGPQLINKSPELDEVVYVLLARQCRQIGGVIDMSARTYEIATKGLLSPALVVGLHEFDVVRVEDGCSYLVGTVPDQAGLHALLRVLRERNVELISIDAVPEDQRIQRFTEL
jgi:hypothetical protein